MRRTWAAIEAASRAQDAFVAIASRVGGDTDVLPAAGLLMVAAHGIADLELSGHLAPEKWRIDGDGLIDLLVRTIQR